MMKKCVVDLTDMIQFTQNKLHSLYPVYILPVYMCIFMPIMKFSHFTNVFIFFYSYKLLFSGFHKQLSCTLMYIIVKYWGYIHAIPPFQKHVHKSEIQSKPLLLISFLLSPLRISWFWCSATFFIKLNIPQTTIAQIMPVRKNFPKQKRQRQNIKKHLRIS